ncbi:dephospho-CoA kinase [Caminibacter pacificus]|jgi:dephospho-CoA kinase|uniref:Dephospho-CoA kinase n=1 Tax=Caminibacter pacificus TaxID=1424653 RepID=A0AAJ4RBD3_9BACT|nr:dephospho-CoA kinase [Caminibacter pacificus]NPA88348.1 dephospho-CoA kinase [Campylobacterota bacterium]QCI27423.1 dephospho-CoA kinase [Caminibacter pacificus]ROR38860.1 dephospho-CoA kinase [Caminibacter pacificus]
MNTKFSNAIVLTGGIGTGKSTVASFLKMYGYKIIDADEISRKVFEEKKETIKEIFGTTDRKELRKIVFNDKEKLKTLENLILPEVRDRVLEMAKKYEKDGVAYFVDLPLFFEKQNYPEFDKVLVVYAPKELQIKRVVQRDNVSEEDAIAVLNNQTDIEIKKQKADFVIDNSKDLKHLQKEIEEFIKKI